MRQTYQPTIGAEIPRSVSITEARRLTGPLAERRSSAGFTLVELLVVIAIIAILAGLLLAAASGAWRTAKVTRITAEMTQFNTALEDYKNVVGSYPPNAQIDDDIATPEHIDDSIVLANFKKHLKRVAPNHREPIGLIKAICGFDPNDSDDDPYTGVPNGTALFGGMNAAEAVVFWLGGFSDDPQYPISGVGGPSYAIESGIVPAFQQDPIESRSWRLDIDIANLGPRDDDNFFDEGDGRYIIYDDPRPGVTGERRINFWYLRAPSSPLPYVYFDASRGSSATAGNDPPAVVFSTMDPNLQYDDPALRLLYYVHAIKRRKTDSNADEPYVFANDGKFQILHGGLDENWGVFPIVNPTQPAGPLSNLWLIDPEQLRATPPVVDPKPLTFPEGPWTLDLADTIASFANGTLEDAE